VVIDHRVRELLADPAALLRTRAMTITRDRVAGPGEVGELLGVHLQQITGAGPLVATNLLARWARHPRQAAALQAATDGRVAHSQL
jgi:hypothetical protein